MRKNISDSKLHIFEKCNWGQMRSYLLNSFQQILISILVNVPYFIHFKIQSEKMDKKENLPLTPATM